MNIPLPSRLFCTAIICGLVLALGVATPSFAGSQVASDFRDYDFQKKDAGKSKAAAYATSNHGGKVLSVDKREQGGRVVYRVKLLQDSGRIKIVTVDGEN